MLALKVLVEGFGFNVVRAASGYHAIGACRNQRFELILMAIQMVELDGFQTAAEICKGDKTRIIPILFITDQALSSESLSQGYKYGAIDFLFRPFEPLLLKKKIEAFCQSRALAQQAEALERSNQELVHYNQKMQKFVGIVAHDLRAPLSKLITISELLLSGVDPDDLKNFFTILLKTSQRGFELVNDILDLSSIQSGKILFDIKECHLTELIKQAVEETSHLAKAKEIEVIIFTEDVPSVLGDSPRLLQVMGNLLNNAIKFTPRAGEIRVEILSDQDEVQVKITDTGVGIAQESLKLLFEKYEDFTTPGTEGERGTGFGLPLSQELMKIQGSEIKVESELGVGSCFSFALPMFQKGKKETGL